MYRGDQAKRHDEGICIYVLLCSVCLFLLTQKQLTEKINDWPLTHQLAHCGHNSRQSKCSSRRVASVIFKTLLFFIIQQLCLDFFKSTNDFYVCRCLIAEFVTPRICFTVELILRHGHLVSSIFVLFNFFSAMSEMFSFLWIWHWPCCLQCHRWHSHFRISDCDRMLKGLATFIVYRIRKPKDHRRHKLP